MERTPIGPKTRAAMGQANDRAEPGVQHRFAPASTPEVER